MLDPYTLADRGQQVFELAAPAGLRTSPLPSPSSDSAHLGEVECANIRKIYRPGHECAKAGVMLMGLQPYTTEQLSWPICV